MAIKQGIPIKESKYYPYIERLRLMDDTFMTVVFDDQPELVQRVLEPILNRTDIQVSSVIAQREYKSVQGRSIRLDICATDTNKKVYDIEIQRANKKDLNQRIRLNLSLLDSKLLEAGEKHGKIPETYVIFILEDDATRFPNSESIRFVHYRYDDTLESFETGQHIVLVNGAYPDDGTSIGKLMHDFRCTSASDMYNSSLADRARYFKEEEKGVRTMCKIADELFNQGIEQGRRNQLVLSIQNILSDGITDIDKIAKYAGASTEEAKEILAELNVSL